MQNIPTRSVDIQKSTPYLLYFMKKLWLSTATGKDANADVIFHFPQEVPKYLAGYYNISKDQAVTLASLIFIAEYGQNIAPLQRPNEVLPYILPEEFIKQRKSQDWKSQIIAQIKEFQDMGLDETAAAQKFLSILAEHQQMFGSTFFVVQQSNDDSLPPTILLAINRKGFHVIDPVTKVNFSS
ncbi:myosin-VIIa-like [Musca autumnalis]|uniref:myosin-VIIa-like n=1 Tax=Musca autumnalis TaxID=221902 RepID=UPI003CEA575D